MSLRFPQVNFLGPRDEYVTSGSDDGNFFVWHKSTGHLHGVYEGDSTVVNVIEPHPILPLCAVSGIDHTVKVMRSSVLKAFFIYSRSNQLFAPVNGESRYSRMSMAESIMRRNLQRSSMQTVRTIRRLDFVTLLESVRVSTLNGGTDENITATADCVNQ